MGRKLGMRTVVSLVSQAQRQPRCGEDPPGGGGSARGQAAPILLILGNEIAGIDPELLTLCEQVIAIPMYGRKRSLNVEVAFAIAAWQIAFLFRRQDE
jgi:tRNA G18 (ribose-2'-O)-methylase SpoU